MNKHGSHAIMRIVNAFGHSLAGLKAAIRSETALQQELLVALIAIPIALFLPLSAVAKALLVMSVFLVLIMELVNTAIERVVDRVSLERHPLSKQAKDIGSALVLLAIINAACVWLLLLIGLWWH